MRSLVLLCFVSLSFSAFAAPKESGEVDSGYVTVSCDHVFKNNVLVSTGNQCVPVTATSGEKQDRR